MNVRKFIAANARDALRKVKETLGDDAIILSNRGVPGGVEIMAVAARDMAMLVPPTHAEPAPRPSQSNPPRARPRTTETYDDYRVSLNQARAQAAINTLQAKTVSETPASKQVAGRNRSPFTADIQQEETSFYTQPNRINPPRKSFPDTRPNYEAPAAAQPKLKPTPVTTTAEVVPPAVLEEIRALRQIVEQHLAGIAWNETTRNQPVRAEVMRIMLDAGFSPQFTRNLLQDLPTDLDTPRALAWIKGATDRELLTASTDNDIVDRGGVYALVGPTGVGKTTTTAKLAARCVLRHGAHKVALITTDSYRIGAHEQLRIYGRILGVSVTLVKDQHELQQVLHELGNKHLVLIDTMGMSQRDKLVPEMTDMLAGCAVQRLLVLSSTSRGDTLDDIFRAYQGAGLAGCVITKTDEAASLGPILDAMIRHNICLHYVSNGQRVPEDLHLPNRGYLLHRALKDIPEASAHRYDASEPGIVMSGSNLYAAGGQRA